MENITRITNDGFENFRPNLLRCADRESVFFGDYAVFFNESFFISIIPLLSQQVPGNMMASCYRQETKVPV